MDVVIFVGPVVHSVVKDKISCFEKAAVAVQNGKIVGFNENGDINSLRMATSNNVILKELKAGQFLCPGFLDIHVHAPQYPNIGLGCDLQLLDWLKQLTLPLEKKFNDSDFAQHIYNYTVETSLRCGTTTACYFGTIHTESCLKLGEIASEKGQRALIGKVNMNQSSIPGYIETTEASIKDTKKFIEGIRNINNPLIEPAITPRFAIACTFDLLKGLGALASQYNLYVQTHICESEDEIQTTKALFPGFKNYGQIYKNAGLLSNKTILGHGVFLNDEEKEMLCSSGSSVAHCPNSNTLLKSGLCPVRDLWEANIKVGLGSDVGGGCNLSILDAMRSALTSSIHVSYTRPNYKPLSYHEAFYLATLGGAIAISKEEALGNFIVGKSFDALVVDMDIGQSPAGVLSSHSLSELVQKFIYCGSDQNIREVYVNGKLVIGKK